MVNPYKLDMYLATQTADLFAELQAVVCADIDFTSCLPEQVRQKLYLGQICGIDFANSRADDYRYLATSHSLIRRCRQAIIDLFWSHRLRVALLLLMRSALRNILSRSMRRDLFRGNYLFAQDVWQRQTHVSALSDYRQPHRFSWLHRPGRRYAGQYRLPQLSDGFARDP